MLSVTGNFFNCFKKIKKIKKIKLFCVWALAWWYCSIVLKVRSSFCKGCLRTRRTSTSKVYTENLLILQKSNMTDLWRKLNMLQYDSYTLYDCWLRGVEEGKSMKKKKHKTFFLLIRDSPTRFSTSSLYHHSNLSGPLTSDQWVKIFYILLRFPWVIKT